MAENMTAAERLDGSVNVEDFFAKIQKEVAANPRLNNDERKLTVISATVISEMMRTLAEGLVGQQDKIDSLEPLSDEEQDTFLRGQVAGGLLIASAQLEALANKLIDQGHEEATIDLGKKNIWE